jgi:hypothetical protein
MKDIRALFRDKPDVTRTQIDALFEKHGFSSSRLIRRQEANFTNQIFWVETRAHGQVILKIQFRQSLGFSLKTEFIATRALRGVAGVPVSESLVYDSDGEPLVFECLLIPCEPGKSGLSYYLGASRSQRLQLGALLGQTVAHIHSQQCPDGLQSQKTRDLASWEGTIREAMFGDEVLASSMAATLPELWGKLLAALDPAPEVRVQGDNVFLWGEAGLHNVLVENSNSLRISNVHDFQSAGWGIAAHDLRQAEGEYVVRPNSEHFESGYVDAFRSSYNAVIEKPLMELSRVEEKILSIVAHLRGIRFFWDCGRLLHPKTSEFLGAAVSDIESLHGVGLAE